LKSPSSHHNVFLGGLFVVCLVLLLFLLNGGVVAISWISSSIALYAPIIEQLLAYGAVGGFATFAIKYEGISWKMIGITKRKFYDSLPILASLCIATTLIAWLGNQWPRMSESTSSGLTLPLGMVIVIVFIAAVVEEYIFRGYIQVGTRKHFGLMAGIVVSAAVFTLAHIPTDMNAAGISSSSQFSAAIPTLAFSAVSRFAFGVMAFAAMYELTGNIFITIFTHSFYDFSVVYYPPVGGSITVIAVCLILPFVVVFLTHGIQRTLKASKAEKIGTLAQ
jgi:membrane protease YdiL (CAAX protease family)